MEDKDVKKWSELTAKMCSGLEKELGKAIRGLSAEERNRFNTVIESANVASTFEHLKTKNQELIEAIKRAQ